MRRQIGAGNIFLSTITASWFLLPLVLASQQQDQQFYRKSPHERISVSDPLASQYIGQGRDDETLDSKKYKHFKDTSVDSNKPSAIATLAPAASHAVRAPRPAQGSGKPAGLSSLLNARSLQDWEVEDFILLATVDGSIHARDRKTGAPRWALEVDRPMVETIYHRENRSALDDYRPEDDLLWIVEPSRDGEIYIYNQGHNGGLQRLRLTVKKLAEELSPYAGEPPDPAVVYTAEKKTTLYTVDAGTGKITKMFSARGSSINDDRSCRRVNGLVGLDEDACGSNGSLTLGRTEYTVGIQQRDTAEPICTLMYSEWGPNNRDNDLQSQYLSTMDQKYVYSRHDGSIFGFDQTRDDRRRQSYTQKLSSPVVRVFDVARPQDSEDQDPQLVILPQPAGPVEDEDLYNNLEDRNRIFVNHTEAGGWYALSESTYPYVTGGAAKAQCYNKDWLAMGFSSQALSLAQRQQAFVGVHSLSDTETREHSFMAISGPPSADAINDTPLVVQSGSPSLPMAPVLANSYIIESAAANATDIILACIVIVIATFLTINRRLIARVIRQNLELRRAFPALEHQLDSVPSSPIVTDAPWKEESQSTLMETIEEAFDQEDGQLTPTMSRRNTLLEPPTSSRSRSGSVDDDLGRAKGSARVRIIEPSASPACEEDEGPISPQPGKKKARRGTRGGIKHKKKRSNSKHEDNDSVEQTIEEVMQIAKEPPLEPDVMEILSASSNIADVSGPLIQIGHLKVYTDTVLGFGSHGTVVYKGSFGGRDVAVKRMLQEFYDIASHEVGLLQESDDHPNVIRYFDKESAGEFLYIALELCPASLQDVIEKPVCYPSLIGIAGLDLPDVLKQITAGVRYLHSLKIVHRDIKPQNILVSAPKKLPAHPDIFQPPRLLISDFGLCKKLEGDQSSFRATTAHAAGTSGWRAPELLVDDDPNTPLATPNLNSSTNPSAHSNSEPLVFDTQTNRRATRAIDIFSLGCVFYYVLTGGNHPFDRDGKYMREANIVKGNYNLADLANLGDYQWEANDLIARMLSHEPKFRPDAGTVLCHPFFWSAEERLEFLCHVSDQFEFEPRDPPSPALCILESYAPSILEASGNDFLRVLPKEFRDTLGKQRKYQGNKLLDLLRALRNKKNHYEDMPESVKEKVGSLPDGYLGFWTRRFPELLMGCHTVVGECTWEGKDRFRRFYGGL